MSIRAGILVILGEADAYGLQVHSELEERTDRTGRINVGQIYSTLERLRTAGLVEASDTTDDGLPLYRLTPAGRRERDSWLAEIDVDAPSAWSDMRFKLLLTSSLAGSGFGDLLPRYRGAWEIVRETATANAGTAPAAADRHLADAALAWIDELEAWPGGAEALARPLRNERPRRGRRPAPAQE
ncbi:MAG: PadR family transcriptional regulator [Herbiconiux sp.]|uniref:PadR family transcriptional regulator n=1 Tax=Herbiconiux sp. TaxID=1871186 RepID=UPI0011F6B7CC|nr:PadR family transcriptional regulator [Herbiconiux sp.]TAJ46320.1 MAG: PadR family transcriptional regulator [Herbiconiux sp.]